jgi:hypothetical protein
MNKDEHISEEQLNAFVDGELESEEKSRLLNESEHSAELDQRLCQQRKLKELVKHAYIDVPPPKYEASSQLAQSGFLGRSLVAGVMLVLGLSGGFVVHNYFDQRSDLTTVAVSEPCRSKTISYTSSVASPSKCLRHWSKRSTCLNQPTKTNSARSRLLPTNRG